MTSMGPSSTVLGIRSENDVGCNDLKVCECWVCSDTVLGFESAFMTHDMKFVKQGVRCKTLSNGAVNMGKTASDACCTCGGTHLHTNAVMLLKVVILHALGWVTFQHLRLHHQGEAWSRAAR